MKLTPIERDLYRARLALEQDKHGECVHFADSALQHDPSCVQALFMAGVALLRGRNFGLATNLFHMASRADPENPAIWNNLGSALLEIDEAESYRAFRRAAQITPNMVEAVQNLCSVCHGLNRYDEALRWAAKCLELEPDNREVLYNSALTLFALGRWKEAWPRYNTALGVRGRKPRWGHLPRWDGRGIGPVVVYGEQGIGDEVMFAAMFDGLRARGGVVLETDPRLVGLYQRSFPWARVYGTRNEDMVEWAQGDVAPVWKIEAGGLGEHFAAEPIRRGAYLQADFAKRQMARAWMDASSIEPAGTLRVGIAWTAGSWSTGRRHRSVPLESLVPLLRTPDVDWFCLEYEDAADDLRWLRETAGVAIHDPRSFVRKEADYDDTAAFVSELDLVIAPTTSIVDLCGALGRPVWALAPHRVQWRYSDALGADRMFWYESARVFRQKEEGAWAAPVMAVRRALEEYKKIPVISLAAFDRCGALVAAGGAA